MGFFRFHHRIKILPGVRWNLGKKSSSVSLGGRGFHYTIGSSGTRTTVGLPGTGVSYTSVHRRQRAERLSDREMDRAMEWSKTQEETFHLEFPDRQADEPPATMEQVRAIHELVRSTSGSDLEHLGTRQADYLINGITQEKARFTERKVHEYLDRRSRTSGTGCIVALVVFASLAYVILHSSH